MMFGPPDKASQHSDASTRWKIRRFSNDELRQKFVDATVPQAQFLGLTIPVPGMKQNEAGNWQDSPIDWDEFDQVLAGNGPCNRDRLAARRKAHEDGAWVREAAPPMPNAGSAAPRGSYSSMVDQATPNTPLWESSSAAAPASPTSTSVRWRPMPRWRCRPRATSTRRGEGLSIWVVPSVAITASDPADKDDALRALEDLPPPELHVFPTKSGM